FIHSICALIGSLPLPVLYPPFPSRTLDSIVDCSLLTTRFTDLCNLRNLWMIDYLIPWPHRVVLGFSFALFRVVSWIALRLGSKEQEAIHEFTQIRLGFSSVVCFCLRQHLVQCLSIKQPAFRYHRIDFLRVANICERVGIEQHQVSNLPRLNRTQSFVQAKKLCGIQSSRSQAFGRSQSADDHQRRTLPGLVLHKACE